MTLLKLIVEIIREFLMIAKEDVEVDESSRARISRFIITSLCCIVLLSFIAVTAKAFVLTKRFKEYRETYTMTSEQCLAKNHNEESSDSGTGIVLPAQWSDPITSLSRGPCMDAWCLYGLQKERNLYGQ